MVEDVVGCKWSLAVLGVVRRGVARPGAIQRAVDGISAKVMNERLAKLVRFGVIAKRAFPEIPPRVEYTLTPFGARFALILDLVDEIETENARRR
jgi:DNA-binding HxlR family transcriptional regulator